MADRPLRPLRSEAVDWPAITAIGLTCIAESAVAWMYADALVTLTTNGRQTLPFWFLMALLLTSAFVPRAAYALESGPFSYERIVGAATALSLILSIKAITTPDISWRDSAWLHRVVDSLVLKRSDTVISPWIVAAFVAAAWWRGRFRAEPGGETSFQLLRLGIPAIFLGAGLLTVMEHGPSDDSVAGAAVAFLVSALSLLAFVRLTGVGSHRLRRIAPIDLATALLPLGATALAALLVVAFVTGDLLATLVWALHPLTWLLTLLVDVILLVLIVLIYVIVAPIFWLIGRGHLDFNSVHLSPPATFFSRPTADGNGSPHSLPDPIRYAIAAAALMLLFAGVNRFILQNWRKRAGGLDDAERTTERPVFRLGALLTSLRHALDARRRPAGDPLAHLRGDPRWAATVRIREHYGQFLVWSANHGHPRRPHQSPRDHQHAFEPRIERADARVGLATITDCYERARYATVPATPDDAAAVETAWFRLTQSMGQH